MSRGLAKVGLAAVLVIVLSVNIFTGVAIGRAPDRLAIGVALGSAYALGGFGIFWAIAGKSLMRLAGRGEHLGGSTKQGG